MEAVEQGPQQQCNRIFRTSKDIVEIVAWMKTKTYGGQ